MPRICEFYGIQIYMYFSDHNPPHFHAEYGGLEAVFIIATGEVADGSLPTRAIRLIREWSAERRAELEVDWELAREQRPLNRIRPLE